MNETPVLALSAENKRRRSPACRFPSYTTHIQTLRLHLIEEQSTKGIISNTPSHDNLLSQTTQSNRCVQGVAARIDGDSLGQYQFARFRKPCQGIGEDIGYHVTDAENLSWILRRIHVSPSLAGIGLSTAVPVFIPHLIFILYFTVSHLHHAEESAAVVAKAVFYSARDEYFITCSNLPYLIGHLHLTPVREHDPQFIEVLMRLQASGLSRFHLYDPYRTRLIACILPVLSPGTFYNAWAIHHHFAPLVNSITTL
jgi:hypothetical protein